MTTTIINKFGISQGNKGRYPYAVLKNLETPHSGPFAVWVFPRGDANGVYATYRGVIGTAAARYTAEGGKLLLVEVGGPGEFKGIMEMILQTIGTPETLLVSGHSNGDVVHTTFHDGKYTHHLGEEDFEVLKGVKKLVFTSCSAGKEGGIAERLSKKGWKVIASRGKNSLREMDIRRGPVFVKHGLRTEFG